MTPKIKNLLVLSLAIIVLIALIWWLIFMLAQKLPTQKKLLRDSTLSSKNILDKLSDVKEYDNTLKFTKNGWALTNSLFINQKDALNIIKSIEKDAQKNNLQLKIKKLDSGAQEAETSLRLNLDLTGSFINIYQFLNAIETYPYFININNININRADTYSQSAKTTKNAPVLETATIIIDVLTQK